MAAPPPELFRITLWRGRAEKEGGPLTEIQCRDWNGRKAHLAAGVRSRRAASWVCREVLGRSVQTLCKDCHDGEKQRLERTA